MSKYCFNIKDHEFIYLPIWRFDLIYFQRKGWYAKRMNNSLDDNTHSPLFLNTFEQMQHLCDKFRVFSDNNFSRIHVLTIKTEILKDDLGWMDTDKGQGLQPFLPRGKIYYEQLSIVETLKEFIDKVVSWNDENENL